MCIETAIPLDDIRKALRINPWAFWGFYVPPAQVTEQCNGIWFETIGDTMTREDLALAVQESERLLADYVGYNLLPKWERQTLYSDGPQVQTDNKGYLIDLGQEKRDLLATIPVVRVDRNGDGFDETGTLNATLYVNTDPNELRVYYKGTDCEIRPIAIEDVGQTRTISFPMYLIPDPDKLDQIDQDGLDHADTGNYAVELDVKRVYNDQTNQISLVYAPGACDGCDQTETPVCGFISEHKLGFFQYRGTTPNSIKANIYSGWQGNTKRPLVEVDQQFVRPVTALAVSLLPKNKPCSGDTQSSIMSFWQTSLTESDEDLSRFVVEGMLYNFAGILTVGSHFTHRFAQPRRLWPR